MAAQSKQEPLKEVSPLEDPTVEEALKSALEHLRVKHDPTANPEVRAAAAEQFKMQRGLISSWLGDAQLFDVGRRSLEAMEFAENQMFRHEAQQADPEAFDAKEAELFPKLTEWRRSNLQREQGMIGSTRESFAWTQPSSEVMAEAFRSGDGSVEGFKEIPRLVDGDGKLVGDVDRASFWRDLGESIGGPFRPQPGIVIDDNVADMKSGYFDREAMVKRFNTAQILHGQLEEGADGKRFVTVNNLDGSPRQVEIPNLSALRDMQFTAPDGTTQTVHVTNEMIADIAKSREGGFFHDTVANFVAKKFNPPTSTFYGEMLVPKITGNDLLDRELLSSPVWQRAVMDTPRPKMGWWDAGQQVYNALEFAGVMYATEGVAGAVGKGARALSATRAYRSLSPVFKATSLARDSFKALGKAFTAGERIPTAATRIPGMYFDVRQIGEEVWYNAVAGMVNGQWQPGQWTTQGVAEGMGEYMLGSIARLSRHGVTKLLDSRWLRDTRVGRFAGKFDVETERAFENIQEGVIKAADKAKGEALQDLIKKGLLDEHRLPVVGELVGALYDTAIVGLGFGAYMQAHRIAARDGRSDIGVEDMAAALGDSETYSQMAGMMLGHGLGVAGGAVWHRNSKDAVPLWPGVLGVELGHAQVKALNDFSAHMAEVATQINANPDVQGLTLAGIDLLVDSDFDIHMKLQEAMKARRPQDVVPLPISGTSTAALVRAHRGDKADLDTALRYESDRGLERMYTTLSNAEARHIPADWLVDIRDFKDLIIDHMQRREDGEPYGQALTGQSMKERESIALAEYRQTVKREAAERRAANEIRRHILRTLKEVGARKAEDEANLESVRIGESIQAKYDDLAREINAREPMRQELLLKRVAKREKIVAELLNKARKEKDAAKRKELEAEAKAAAKAAKVQARNDKNAAKRQKAADARALKRAKQAKDNGETAPLDAGELQDATGRIARNLEITPEHAHDQGNPAAIVDAATDGIDPSDTGALRQVAADAEAEQAAKAAARPKGRRIREPEAEAELPPASPREELERLVAAEHAGHRAMGAEVFHPKEAGKHLDAMKTAAVSGHVAAMDAEFGYSPEVRQAGRERQESMAVGMMLATSLNPRVDSLTSAITGLPAADVARLRLLLEARYEGIDEQIATVLAEWQLKLGYPILSTSQLKVAETKRLLRLIAMGADIKTTQSGSGILAGARRSGVAEELGRHVSEALSKHAASGALLPKGGDLAGAARAMAANLQTRVGDAVAALPKTGLRTEGLWHVLRKKLAYNLTGKQNSDDMVAGTRMTVRNLTDQVVEQLSQGGVSAGNTAGGSVKAITQAAAGGKEERVVSVGELEKLRRSAKRDELDLAREVISLQANAHRLSVAVNVRNLEGEDGKPIVRPGAPSAEVRRIEAEVYRGLLDGDKNTVLLLLANEWSAEDILAVKAQAEDVRAHAQQVMGFHVQIAGMPVSGAVGEHALLELTHLLNAFEMRAAGTWEKVDGEAKAMLEAGGWLGKDGRLREDAGAELFDIARQTVFDGLSNAEIEAAKGNGDIFGIIEARDELSEHASIEPFYAGLGANQVLSFLHLMADLSTGWYDLRLDKPYRHKFETISDHGLVSMSRVLDVLAKKHELGPLTNKFGRFFLRAWVQSVSGKVRGVQSKTVREKNFAYWRADTEGKAKMHRFLAVAEASMKRLIDMQLPTDERLFLSKMIGIGAKRDIRSQEAWTAAFGEPYARLYPVFLEMNDVFKQTADELVAQGILDPKRSDALVDAYLPRRYVELMYGAQGNPVLGRKLESKKDSTQLGGFEYAREGQRDREDVRRMYDIAYVLPDWAGQVSQSLRISHTLNRMIELGVHVSRDEYLNMPDSERWQFKRLALPGKLGVEGGLPDAAFTKAEDEYYRPPQMAAERALELKERREADLEQVIVGQWIKSMREMHSGEGAPELTPKMAQLLNTLETAYVPLNVAVEVGILADQTSLGPSINDSASFEFASNVSLAWRRLRTVYNPAHWVMQVFSNWGTNAATGKVPLHDILNPRGSYWRSSKALGQWQRMIASGEDPALSPDPEIQHAHRFMLRGGVNTFAAQFNDPVNGPDIVAGFVGKIQRQWRQSGQTMSDTLTSQLMEKAAGSGRALSDARRWVDFMANGTSPDSRAEALRALHGMYGFLDLVPKYAAQLEGERRGWGEAEAYHWGTEGTGDFADVNPRIRQLSTNFSLSHGPLYGKARTALGLGERIGTARAGASTAEKAWRWTESIRHSGLAGPFWMYRATMNPSMGRAAVHMPMKAMTTFALGTFAIRVLSAYMSKDEDDYKLLLASQAGRGSFLHEGFDSATFDAYAKTYGKAPAWGMGPMTIAVNDWVRFTKAFARNFIHADPEAEMLFMSRGPTIAGDETVIDFSSMFTGVNTAMWLANKLHGIGEPKPFAQPEGLGVAHLPAAIASVAVAALEGTFGVQGKSRSRVIGEHLSELAAEWSTPLGGMPWIFSRFGQQVFGSLAWDGRSIGRAIDGLPATGTGDALEGLGGAALRSLVPIRRIPSGSAMPSDGRPLDTLEDLLGTRVRTRDMPSGSEAERQAARTAELAKSGMLDAITWAYTQARENGAPLGLWNAKALDLGRDLKTTTLSSGRLVVDVVDKPQTIIGQFIRNAAPGEGDRQALAAEVVAQFRRHRDDIVKFAEDPRGLASHVALPPALYKRMIGGVWDKEINAPEMLKLIHRELTDKGARKASGGAYDETLARFWRQSGMDRLTERYKSGANLRMTVEVQQALSALRAAHPDMDPTPIAAEDLRKWLGAKLPDAVPTMANRRPAGALPPIPKYDFLKQ